ncbi:uncharacterized protein LOC100908655 [Galendromus occidentalis]|uniref:Uncharacterized protein LOC100908655 n=1 Tax=Galendromus occidentalis TaxID=34638 RepID=A0AAJ7L5M0_9ACAR|nr:uncharacterized protein LOC100908655 [Galendromus occidentalis]
MAHIKEEVSYVWNSTYGVRIDEAVRPQNIYLSKIALRAANVLMPARIEHSFIEATFNFKSNRFDLLCRFLVPCVFCVSLAFFSFLELLRTRCFTIIWMATIMLSVSVFTWPPAICAFQLASLLAIVSYSYIVATMFVSLCGPNAEEEENPPRERCPVKELLSTVVTEGSPNSDMIVRIALSVSYFLFVVFYLILINKTA